MQKFLRKYFIPLISKVITRVKYGTNLRVFTLAEFIFFVMALAKTGAPCHLLGRALCVPGMFISYRVKVPNAPCSREH